MKLDPDAVNFVPPMGPGLFVRPLRFVGREKTVHLQETALVIEGNLLKVSLLGLERLFRRALAEWTSLTVPYSRIDRIRLVRLPTLRLISLIYLILFPLFCLLVLLGKGGIGGALTGFALGFFPGVLFAYIFFRMKPRTVIDFRTKGGQRTRLVLEILGKKRRRKFVEQLKEYRTSAKEFAPANAVRERSGPRPALVAGVAALLLLTTGAVAYLGKTVVWPQLARMKVPGSGGEAPDRGFGGPGPGPQFNPTPRGAPTTAGGSATAFTFDPLSAEPSQGPAKLEHTKDAFLSAVAWLPNDRVATAGNDGAVRVWNLKTGKGTTYTLSKEWGYNLLALTADATAPAGVRAVFFSWAHGLRLWSVGAAEPPALLRAGGYVSAAGFDPTGRVLAFHNGNPIYVWDVATRTELGRREVNGSILEPVNLSADPVRAVMPVLLMTEPMKFERKLVVWAPGTATELDGFAAAALGPDGTTIAARTVDKEPRLKLIGPNGQLQKDLGPTAVAGWLTYAPNGRVLAGGLADDRGYGIGFWNPTTGRLIGQLSGLSGSRGALSTDGASIAVLDFNSVKVWRVPSRVTAALRGEPEPPFEIAPPPRPVTKVAPARPMVEIAPPPRPVKP